MTDRRPLARRLMWLCAILLAASVSAFAGPENTAGRSSAPGDMTPEEEDRIVASLPVVPPGLNSDYVLTRLPPKTVSATLTLSAKYPNLTISEYEVFLPVPPDLPGQKIENLKTEPAMQVVEETSPLHRKLLRVKVQSPGAGAVHEVNYSISFDAILLPRILVKGKPPALLAEPVPLTETERKLALRPTTQLDYTSPAFTSWLDQNHLQRAEKEGEVDFARRVYEAIGKNISYELWTGHISERASFVCTISKGTCGGFSNVFVAALRSQGIPARALFGRLARAAGKRDFINGAPVHLEHVMAEYYAQGLGWVPVEVTGATAKDSQRKATFFATGNPIFITMHVDPDLTIPTGIQGLQKARELICGHWWWHARGNLDGHVAKYDWTFK
jgi:transglutaminase-like putative cysteine protease